MHMIQAARTYQSRFRRGGALTQPELLDISQRIQGDFLPKYSTRVKAAGKNAHLSTSELLSISDEISLHYKASRLHLPKQDTILLLPVDPRHLHAFWNTASLTQAALEESLVLRVFENTSAHAAFTHAQHRPQESIYKDHLEIPVSPSTSQCNIELPAHFLASSYSAEIAVKRSQGRYDVLLCSEQTTIPELTAEFSADELDDKPSSALPTNPSGKKVADL